MKNFLIFILFVASVVGCGISYMLLRMPQHEVTALILKYLAVNSEAHEPKPESPAPEAAETEPGEKPKAESAPANVQPEDDKAWKGLSADDWYAGKRLSERDFRNKVVLVYAWNSKEKASVALLSRIEEIWTSFKDKPLVVVGSHRGGRNPKIPNACKQLGLTFPMYEGAAFGKEPSVSRYPYIYIVNAHGKVVYRGISDRSATEALVEALTACMLKQ